MCRLDEWIKGMGIPRGNTYIWVRIVREDLCIFSLCITNGYTYSTLKKTNINLLSHSFVGQEFRHSSDENSAQAPSSCHQVLTILWFSVAAWVLFQAAFGFWQNSVTCGCGTQLLYTTLLQRQLYLLSSLALAGSSL